MEKAKKLYKKTYPMLRLYKDDIEEIVHIFERNYERVEIIIAGYQIHKTEEIEDIRKTSLTDCQIVGMREHNPSGKLVKGETVLVLAKNRAEISLTDGEDTFLLGVISQIDDILLRRKSILEPFINAKARLTYFFIFLSLLAIFALLQIFNFYYFINWFLYITIFEVFILSFIVLSNLFRQSNYIKIESIYYRNKSNFFQRKKDDILLAILSLAVGAILAFGTAWLTGHLH